METGTKVIIALALIALFEIWRNFKGKKLGTSKSIETKSEAESQKDNTTSKKQTDHHKTEKKKKERKDENDSDWDSEDSEEFDQENETRDFEQAADYLKKGNDNFDIEKQLMFYGLYKVATVGPCNTSQPAIYQTEARAKWGAWTACSQLSSREAKNEYVQALTQLAPNWRSIQSTVQEADLFEEDYEDEKEIKLKNEKTGEEGQNKMMGPVFSLPTDQADEEGDGEEADELVILCRKGQIDVLDSKLDDPNHIDSQGLSLLHWACDKGKENVIRFLISKGADPNIRDSDGQTPLEAAIICETPEIVKLLVSLGADPHLPTSDGASHLEISPPFIKQIIEDELQKE